MTSITEINITNMNISLLLLLRFLYKARNETINNNMDIRLRQLAIRYRCKLRVSETNPRTPMADGMSFLDVRSPGGNFLTKSE